MRDGYYPMVAPAYAATRRELAKKIGLGRKPGQKSVNTETAAEAAPIVAAAAPVVAARVKVATKPKAAAKGKPAARKAPPKSPASEAASAEAKPARRKKLGLQFGANGAGSEA